MAKQRESIPTKTDFINPFVYDKPVNKQGPYINRDRASNWVKENLKNKISLPLIIEGEPGVGKTTMLLEVKNIGQQLELISLYVDLKGISTGSFIDFLWGLGRAISRELLNAEIEPPPLEKRMLVIRPWQAFRQRFWQQLPAEVQNRGLLLILDNFDRLASKLATPETNRAFRQYLYELLSSSQEMYLVAAITGRLATFSPPELVPFNRLLRHELTLLSEEQTHKLLNMNGTYHISTPVATYIHSLTWGHPGDVQRLGYALFERMSNNNFTTTTVADVVSTLRTDMKPGNFKRAVIKQRAKVSYYPSKKHT